MELFDGRYEKLTMLGKGAFSEVWKVLDTETERMEALKIYTASKDISDESVRLFTHEFALLADASHPNLLQPRHFAISKPDGYPYLLLKYCNNGSVGMSIGKFSEEEAWKLMADIASALEYLHAMNPPIIHQDIKPGNILIDGEKYMLSDFGVSTSVKSSLSHQAGNESNIAGTVPYMAPEKFTSNSQPIMANDIYSLGCTIYELITGELPFGDDGGLTQDEDTIIPDLKETFSEDLRKTLHACLMPKPWDRPTAAQLVKIANEKMQQLADFIPSRPTIPINDNINTVDDGMGHEDPSNIRGGSSGIIKDDFDELPDNSYSNISLPARENTGDALLFITMALIGIATGIAAAIYL